MEARRGGLILDGSKRRIERLARFCGLVDNGCGMFGTARAGLRTWLGNGRVDLALGEADYDQAIVQDFGVELARRRKSGWSGTELSNM